MEKLQKEMEKAYKSAQFIPFGKEEKWFGYQNKFSRHYVFILEDFEQLVQQWESLHNLIVEEYLHFQEEEFLEWNFYCVFVINSKNLTDEQRTKVQIIEQDRSYTRKFVRLSNEVQDLPPGITEPDPERSNLQRIIDVSEKWEQNLGKDLYRRIFQSKKAHIEDEMEKFLEALNE